MYLKSDFEALIRDAVASKPAVAAAYRAGDPRVLAQLEAMAAMLAMFSAQLDVAEVEPFVRARLGTVLADCALKGVLPLAKPAKVELTVTNAGTAPVTIAAGRGVLDAKGRRYVVDGSATVAGSGGTGTITAVQMTTRTLTHTVGATQPFYELLLEPSEEGVHVAGLDVADVDGPMTYAPDFCNVAAGDRVFHVETDEYRRLIIRFGAEDGTGPVVGHQPANGDVLTVTLRECAGRVDVEAGAAFALEYVDTGEQAVTLTLSEVLAAGANPPDADTLRMLSRYPALHDGNAVFLSNFDFLLRRHLSGLEFLSVWNEQVEEAARGANVLNINKLFVSFKLPAQVESLTQDQVRTIIGRADNSYKVAFIARREVAVPITVTASVSSIHDPGDVQAQIRTVLLQQYGQGSVAASRGLNNVFRLQQLNQVLYDSIPAFQDPIADFSVVIGSTPSPLPEDYRFVTSASLTITVTRATTATGLWNL